MRHSLRTIANRCALTASTVVCVLVTRATPILAQATQPQIERPIAFDSAGRITLLTPAFVSRLSIPAPQWPLKNDWKEARLYAADESRFVLVASLVDGSMARYPLTGTELSDLRGAINTALLNRSSVEAVTRGGATGLELSQSAGNAFVRNQTFVGLAAYGPATAALLSDTHGGVAFGGYLLAAGASFFVSASTVHARTVTRAQNILATHAAIRGAITGLGVGKVFKAKGAPTYGGLALGGAIIGTGLGFHAARGMSDGEAASSGVVADILALTSFGVSRATGSFRDGIDGDNNRAAIGITIGSGLLGYVVGPHYARRSSYNVTAGDADVVFAASTLGALTGIFIGNPKDNNEKSVSVWGTAGLLSGFILADRTMVRTADRTSADGTWATLGGVAGLLVGTGFAAVSKSEDARTYIGAATAGGIVGLVVADRMLSPAKDAGPVRGVIRGSVPPSSSLTTRDPVRVQWSLASAATSVAAGLHGTQVKRTGSKTSVDLRGPITNIPALRITF